MTTITGQTAFITGGGSGLGLATAHALAERGARVVIADVDRERLDVATDELRAANAEVLPVVLDVTDEASWAAAGEAAHAFRPVGILFSNAGVGGGSGAFENYDPEVWRWNYAVNAHAHLYACRTFLGAMKAADRPAHLVLTSSMVAIVPPPISVAYISSKYATLGIAMALRNELAGSNVAVSVLMPGMSATRIVETTRELRPVAVEVGAAASTSQGDAGRAGRRKCSPSALARASRRRSPTTASGSSRTPSGRRWRNRSPPTCSPGSATPPTHRIAGTTSTD